MNNYLIYNNHVSNGLLDILLINDYIIEFGLVQNDEFENSLFLTANYNIETTDSFYFEATLNNFTKKFPVSMKKSNFYNSIDYKNNSSLIISYSTEVNDQIYFIGISSSNFR